MKKGCLIFFFTIASIVMALMFCLVVLILIDCKGMPGEDEFRNDFLKVHPSAEIVSIYWDGEDCGAIYFIVKYRLPGEEAIKEDVWYYSKSGGGKWTNTRRESTGRVVPPGPP